MKWRSGPKVDGKAPFRQRKGRATPQGSARRKVFGLQAGSGRGCKVVMGVSEPTKNGLGRIDQMADSLSADSFQQFLLR